jgi:Bifunctional DNA primase/polymerase, N-terminal/Primase C terminal 2 (PriCT-2)
MNLAVLPIFPCNTAKEPLAARGFKSARLNVKHSGWPLIGFPTGAASGIDVLDVDPKGVGWFDANFDGLPRTRAHQTQRGLHLLFKAAPGLRCSTSKIAAGIDVRADGGYAIWWPREGLPIEDHPICEWPEWLLKEAMEACGALRPHTRDLTTLEFISPSVVPELRAALFQLDPIGWRGDGSVGGYLRWFHLLCACKAAGIACEEFVEWCTQDRVYAHHARKIERKWESAQAQHTGALIAALKEAGIPRPRPRLDKLLRGGVSSRQHSAIDWRRRYNRALDKFEAGCSEQGLWNAACNVADIIRECKKPNPSLATDQLLAICKAKGLTALLGEEVCREKIVKAFRYVKELNKQTGD